MREQQGRKAAKRCITNAGHASRRDAPRSSSLRQISRTFPREQYFRRNPINVLNQKINIIRN